MTEFNRYSIWAQYYEPEDIETLVKLGFAKKLVTEKYEGVGYPDEYWFPIPDDTTVDIYKFDVLFYLRLIRN